MSESARESANGAGTHYDVLGVSPHATADAIDDQFRALAKVVHPDHGGDAVMFEVLMESYNVLRDPAQRAEYDRSLRAAAKPAAKPTAQPTAQRPTTRSRPAPPRQERYYGRFTEAEWQRALQRSLSASILATIFRRRSRRAGYGGFLSRPGYEPTTWPLADPSTMGQFVNAFAGAVIVIVMMSIVWLILAMLIVPTSPAP